MNSPGSLGIGHTERTNIRCYFIGLVNAMLRHIVPHHTTLLYILPMLKCWGKINTVICYYLIDECELIQNLQSKMGLMCVKLLLMYFKMLGSNLINRIGMRETDGGCFGRNLC